MKERNQTYIRRCHKCSYISSATGTSVDQCHKCKKYFPKVYFYQEEYVQAVSDNELRPIEPSLTLPYQPIRGLTVFWSQSD